MPDIEGPYTVTAPLDLTDYGEAVLIAAEAQRAGFPRVAVDPEHFLALVAEVSVARRERDEARDIAAKWFGAGAVGSSRWCDRTLDLWYAHRRIIQSWPVQEARP